MSDALPLIDDLGLVLQDDRGVYLDDVSVSSQAITKSRLGAAGDILLDEFNLPLVDNAGYVLQDDRGILFDDVSSYAVALTTGRVGAAGDILYDDGTLMSVRRATIRRPHEEHPDNTIKARTSIELDDHDAPLIFPGNAEIINLTARVLTDGGARVSVGLRLGTNFVINYGRETALNINIVNVVGSPTDLTGYRVIWIMERPGSGPVLYKTSDDSQQIDVFNRTSGALRVYLQPEDTKLSNGANKSFNHRLILDKNGEQKTVLNGVLRIVEANEYAMGS